MLSAGSKNELVIKLFRVKPAANFCGRLIVLLFRAYKSGAENFSLQTKRIESEGFTFVRTTCDEIQKSGRGSNERPDVSPLAFSDSILCNAEAAHSALGRSLEPTPQHVFFRLLIMFSLTNYRPRLCHRCQNSAPLRAPSGPRLRLRHQLRRSGAYHRSHSWDFCGDCRFRRTLCRPQMVGCGVPKRAVKPRHS